MASLTGGVDVSGTIEFSVIERPDVRYLSLHAGESARQKEFGRGDQLLPSGSAQRAFNRRVILVACFPDTLEEWRRQNGGWHRFTPRCLKFFSQMWNRAGLAAIILAFELGNGKQMAQYMCQLQEYFSQPCNPRLPGRDLSFRLLGSVANKPGIWSSMLVDMMIPRLLELRQRNEKKLAEGSVKM